MFKSIILIVVTCGFFVGCSSSQIKARKEQRNVAAQQSKIYCDFVNGELYPDVEVMLNLEMAKKCDNEKSMSISSYKTSNENTGIVFCCAMADKSERSERTEKSSESPVSATKVEKKTATAPAAAGDNKAAPKNDDLSLGE